MPFQNETFSLYKSFVSVRNLIHYLDHILSSPKIAFSARNMLNLAKKRAEGILKDFTSVLGVEALQTFKDEMASDTMIYDALWDKLSQLKEGQRWEIEKQIDKLIEKNKK